MGCSGSKPEATTEDTTTPSDVKIDLKTGHATTADGRRKSLTKRRVAVRANHDDFDESEDIDVSFPKTEEESESLMKWLLESDLFSGLTNEQAEKVVAAFQGVSVEAGQDVIVQGEPGDHLYMVGSGKYEASLFQAEDKVVASYTVGMAFGELALLYDSHRAATIKCIEDGKLWALERKVFRHAVVKTGSSNIKNVGGFLKSVHTLSLLTDEQRATMADAMTKEVFDDGAYLVEMGQPADSLFVIQEGEVVCHKGDQTDLTRLKKGDVFGESCLQPDEVRKANVVAVGKVSTLKLTANAFKDMLGELSELLSYNFKRKVIESVMIDKTFIFDLLPAYDKEMLLNRLVETSFQEGEAIIKQGEANNTFHIIKSGKALVKKREDGEAEDQLLAELGEGQFFGERALLKDEPANATVCAKDTLNTYSCDRDTFNELLGPLQGLIDGEVAKRADKSAPPPKWSDLELRRILGVGTFGRVKLVYHKEKNTSYALKCIRKAQVVATKQQLNVLNEKRILLMVDHPFVLKLVQTYQDQGELYMLLELCLGGELFSLLDRMKLLSDSHAKFYLASVVSIFVYLHDLKVIYRDLKPENLLLDDQGYIKMVDFGFAKILKDRSWTLCGTPEYLSPEIILNKGHGFGADWWCTGILAYECLTGQTPFVANDPLETYRKIIKCNIAWPRHLPSNNPARNFISSLLVVEPSHRLGSSKKQGPQAAKTHPWLSSVDFKALEAKKLPAPFVPEIKSKTDDSHFDHFNDDGKANYPGENFPAEMFSEFASEWV